MQLGMVGLGRMSSRFALIHNGGTRMQLGMVGLGRMGANMVRRLFQKGHE